MEAGKDIIFTTFQDTKEGPKGGVIYFDGTKVKPGTYKTLDGDILAVQPGLKATLKSALL